MSTLIAKYNDGVKKGVSGDFEAARSLFSESLQFTKFDRPSIECQKLAEDAIAGRISRDAGIHMFKSVQCFDQGDTYGMASELEKVLETEPTYARAHTDLGNTLGMAGNHKQAITKYKDALSHDSSYAMAHFNLGYAYSNTGDSERSAEHYHKAIEIDPYLAEAYNNLAFYYARKKETDLMAEYRNRAIELGYQFDDRALQAALNGQKNFPWIVVLFIIALILYFAFTIVSLGKILT